jgi:hypothetical protein
MVGLSLALAVRWGATGFLVGSALESWAMLAFLWHEFSRAEAKACSDLERAEAAADLAAGVSRGIGQPGSRLCE